MARQSKKRRPNHRRRHKKPHAQAGEENTENAAVSVERELTSPPQEPTPTLIDKGDLRKQAEERAKKRPIRERIAAFFRPRDEEKEYNELIINSEALERRVAHLRDGVLENFSVERKGEDRMVGAVYKGVIQNLEPGLKAAFVDIGEEKNAFLHYWDMLPGAGNNDKDVEIVRENKSTKNKRPVAKSLKDIEKVFPIGSEIIIQVTKGQIGTKGPRSTTNLALAGRFLVLMPFAGQCGISRKIEDKTERARLKRIIQNLDLPEGMGLIIRTVGENKPEGYFARDLSLLRQQWDEIEAKIKGGGKRVGCLYQEPDLIGITARDFLTDDVDRVQLDRKEDYDRLVGAVERISPKAKRKINLFEEKIPIFERFNVERQIEQTFMRTVPLPSGGEIVIEETEALVSVDVNTGGHKSDRKDGKNFILQANVEAAVEVARQARLRNLGGLLIIDFIDMKNKSDQQKVYRRMKQVMANDKAKHNILPISQLGIMQITRQRHEESNASGIYEGCPYCSGRGIVKSPRSVSIEIQRRISSAVRSIRANETRRELKFKVYLHPNNLRRLRGPDAELVRRMERNYDLDLAFEAAESFHVENFKIIDEETEQELR